jgi:P-type E1-E2 ATPase
MMKDADVEFEEAIAPDSAQPDRGGAVYLARNDRPLATFVFSESLRPTARRAVQGLQRLGCTVRMLTGDRADRGAALAGELDVAALTEQSPQDKLAALRAFRGAVGPVAMVGDGINDAPSLAAADVGIAMACGADVSREAADVCLIGDDLRALPRAIHLARRTVRTIRMNLLWAFAYNAIGLPLAMTGKLNPVFAAVAMVASSLAVVANSARLRRIGLMEEP